MGDCERKTHRCLALGRLVDATSSLATGCSAAWLARLTGGQKVAGSNPVTPTKKNRNPARVCGFFVRARRARFFAHCAVLRRYCAIRTVLRGKDGNPGMGSGPEARVVFQGPRGSAGPRPGRRNRWCDQGPSGGYHRPVFGIRGAGTGGGGNPRFVYRFRLSMASYPNIMCL